jgi:hypothetical protein
MTGEAIGLGVSGLVAGAYGVRTLVTGSPLPGRSAHGIARIITGAALLGGGAGLATDAIAFFAGPWMWGAVAIAYGSIGIELVQLVRASRARKLTEADRLRRHISNSSSHTR